MVRRKDGPLPGAIGKALASMIRPRFRFARLVALALVIAAAPAAAQNTAVPAAAQSAAAPTATAPQAEAVPAVVSHPVIEPTAPSAGKALNEALVRLAKDPRNADALMAAGQAALALGDNDAALGFFTRADQVNPGQGAVHAAIAGARLRMGDPVEALRQYAEAEKSGVDPAAFASDRALAYDLVGDTAAALPEYRRAIEKSAPGSTARDEAVRRQAISLAIGGDRRAADLALLPLLQRQDRAAWRTHIFVLAIAGRADEAVRVAGKTMPADLAASVGPYLRFMARLTPAQQAAVANLGRFPRAADIGRDDPAILAYAAQHPHPAAPVAAAPVQVAEAASPIDAKTDRNRKRRGREAAAPAPVRLAIAAEPEPVLPEPPPPPVVATPAPPVAPMVPPATRTPAPEPAANLPRPAVLSKLDLPPATGAAPAAAAPATVSPGAAPVDTAATEKAAKDKAARDQAARDKAARDRAAKDKLAREKADKAEKERIAREAADAELDPCPPVRHAKAAAAEEPARSAKGKGKGGRGKSGKGKASAGKAGKTRAGKAKASGTKATKGGRGRKGRSTAAEDRPQRGRHAAKGRHQAAAADSDTCAAKRRGERPDAPSGVSRDAEPDDTAARTKAKPAADKTDKADKADKAAKAKADKADKADKPGKADKPEKGGRKARYASRIWVQVLTGADREKMAGEWRAMVKKAHPLKGHKPYITAWRSNFRLLTGPFDSDAEAQAFIGELKKDGVSGFEWTSPAGQAVDSLALP